MLKMQQEAMQKVIQNIKEDKKKLGERGKKVNEDEGLVGLGRRVTAEWKVIIFISKETVSLSLFLSQRQLDTIFHLLRSEVTRELGEPCQNSIASVGVFFSWRLPLTVMQHRRSIEHGRRSKNLVHPSAGSFTRQPKGALCSVLCVRPCWIKSRMQSWVQSLILEIRSMTGKR